MLPVEKILKAQQANRSFICLGLDLDPKKMPKEHASSPKGMFDFVKAIVDATADQVCAYKPNLAFYEALGSDGFALLQLIVERIPDNIPVIIDGKRNDIGNTATQYASSLFDYLKADWITINPYMGYDSMRPFLERKDKGAFVLCLTSNAGSKDFQLLQVDGRPLYEVVAERVNYWNKDNNCGLVVGATHPSQLGDIRALAGDMPILIPGVGAQGGSLEDAIVAGTDGFRKPAVINVSRSVLYASRGDDFASKARQELARLNAIVTKVRYGDQSEGKANGPSKDQQPAPQNQGAPQEAVPQEPQPEPPIQVQPTEQATPPDVEQPRQPEEPEPPDREPSDDSDSSHPESSAQQ